MLMKIFLEEQDGKNLHNGEFAEYYEENDITEYEMYQVYKDFSIRNLNISVMKGKWFLSWFIDEINTIILFKEPLKIRNSIKTWKTKLLKNTK